MSSAVPTCCGRRDRKYGREGQREEKGMEREGERGREGKENKGRGDEKCVLLKASFKEPRVHQSELASLSPESPISAQ